MRNLIIITILFFNTICQAQVPIGDDDLSEIWRCTSHDPEEEATDDYYPPDFRAGLLYYKILSQYSDTIVEVYWPACECDEDANYSQLDTCIVPERVIYKDKSYTVKGIGFCAFRRCMKKLRKVILPNTITYIAQGAFNECDSLTNINIPASLKRVGPPDAFMTPYIYRIYKQLPDSIEYVKGADINPWWLLINTIGYNTDNTYYHYIKDHLGNICAVVKSMADTTIQSTIYYAFGVPMAQSWGKDRQPYLYNGQRVLQSAQTDIDVSALPQGMYILRAETTDGNAHQAKLIKQ